MQFMAIERAPAQTVFFIDAATLPEAKQREDDENIVFLVDRSSQREAALHLLDHPDVLEAVQSLDDTQKLHVLSTMRDLVLYPEPESSSSSLEEKGQANVGELYVKVYKAVEPDVIRMAQEKQEVDSHTEPIPGSHAQQAMEVIYTQYKLLIYKYLARRFDGPRETVEDLTEDVFIKVWEKLGKYQQRGLPFSAWLYRIAHNHLVDYLRGKKDAMSLNDAPEVINASANIPLVQVERRAILEPALARLTQEQADAVCLRFLEGCSVSETAQRMGRSEEAVKKLQARALANLRRILQGEKR